MIRRREGKTNQESTEVFQVRSSVLARATTVSEEGRARSLLTGLSEAEPTGSHVKAEEEGDLEISVLDFWLPFVELCPCARDCALCLKEPILFNLLVPYEVVSLAPFFFFFMGNVRGDVTCPRSHNQ